jgi:hypothetical protein
MARKRVVRSNSIRFTGKVATVAILAAWVLLAGCSDDDEPSTFVVRILSDQRADGDIGFNPFPEPEGTYLISQADSTGNLFFGIDEEEGTEYRAFLDFPLDGSTGGGSVPLGAVIVSADVEVFVNSVEFASSVPTLLDLVPFPMNGLEPTDFDSRPIATRSPFDFFRSDEGNYVLIDVTSLMAEAQSLGLQDLQLRLLLDFVQEPSGLVELDDGADADMAPLLTVEYR